jgi:hypothetical protein
MKGYERLEPFAMTGLRPKLFPTPGTLGTGRLADLNVLERNQNDYAALQNEVRQKHPYLGPREGGRRVLEGGQRPERLLGASHPFAPAAA